MGSLLSQVNAVIIMNIRSLPQRIWMSLAMVISSSVVVAILLAFLAMAKGFDATLSSAGAQDVAIFMREGTTSELGSSISREQANLVGDAPGVIKDGEGPISSGEIYVIVDGTKKSSQTDANIPLRGIGFRGIEMRQNVVLIQGRMFTPGTNELIVGAGIIREFDGFNLDQEVKFGKNIWKVVGVFSSGGSVFESEIWADIRVIQSLYNRSGFQTVRVKISSENDIETIKAYVENDPRLNLVVQTEQSYFQEQGKQLGYMALFGRVISMVMALGAIAGALNTMYTSVSERAREMATLRAIGFSSLSSFVGTLFEAMVLAVIGGVIGSLAAFLLFDGLNASTLGGGFTQVVFSFELGIDLFFQGATMALAIGFISGFFPAWKAAKLPVAVAFSNAA